MAILLTGNSKIIVQGITGHQGQFHTKAMLNFGTNVVAGVTPGKAGENVYGVKVYDNVRSAVDETKADTAVVFVPAPFVKDAVIEDIDAGLSLVVIVTEHVPFHDVIDLLEYGQSKVTRIIGPNCPGIASSGLSKAGIIPNSILKPGNIGVLSRSGTLTYEIVNQITKAGLGESTVIGLGGDKVVGSTFTDLLSLFENDAQTSAVVMVGEIGGSAEEDAADFIKKNFSKPVIGFIAGKYAPPGKRMGHAGAIISGNKGTANSKITALESAGALIAASPEEVPRLLLESI